MVNESWFSSLWRISRKNGLESEKLVIGVLTFEVANLMSKVVHMWECMSDKQLVRLREEIMGSEGVRKVVSDDDDFLVGLMCGEIIENLDFMATFVGRLGKRCTDPALRRFEHAFNDLVHNNVDLYGWQFTLKKMERKVKKMGRFIMVNASLYQELEVLAELEQTLRRMRGSNDPSRRSLLDFYPKVVWQRQEVKNLREMSLWNRTYDYTVRLLARSLFTIFRRIKYVFGIHQTDTVVGINDSRAINADYLPRSHSISVLMQSSIQPSVSELAKLNSGPLGSSCIKSGSISGTNNDGWSTTSLGLNSSTNKTRNGKWHTQNQSSILSPKQPHCKVKRLSPVGPFKGCMLGGSDSSVIQSFTPVSNDYQRLDCVSAGVTNGAKDGHADSLACSNTFHANPPFFSSKCKVLNTPMSTLGAAALALHYANVIIIIEKLVETPHLIGPDARDDLYNMLPRSLRVALRERLKSYGKNLTSVVYDTNLALQWSEALTGILEWLAPLAHNMIRWQSERNFEQQHMVSRTNVLLVQTLYFADQTKTEAAITELLVGVNYLWRFGRELNAKAGTGVS